MTIDKTALSYWFPKIEAAGIPVPRTMIFKMPADAQAVIWGGFDGKKGNYILGSLTASPICPGSSGPRVAVDFCGTRCGREKRHMPTKTEATETTPFMRGNLIALERLWELSQRYAPSDQVSCEPPEQIHHQSDMPQEPLGSARR